MSALGKVSLHSIRVVDPTHSNRIIVNGCFLIFESTCQTELTLFVGLYY